MKIHLFKGNTVVFKRCIRAGSGIPKPLKERIRFLSPKMSQIRQDQYAGSFQDPDPYVRYVLGPFGSVSQIYVSGFFQHQAKTVTKAFILTVL
jgi:hypothetical protein